MHFRPARYRYRESHFQYTQIQPDASEQQYRVGPKSIGSGAKSVSVRKGEEEKSRDYAAITAFQISGEVLSFRCKRSRENCFL
jgi:hypothetical protein